MSGFRQEPTRRVLGVLGLAVAAGVMVAVAVPRSAADESQDPTSEVPNCRVTIPNGSKPPGERFEAPGNGDLWAGIPRDGRVVARPPSSQRLPKLYPDGSIKTKVLWLGRRSSKTHERQLTITGKRLDGEAKPFRKGPSKGGWNGEALYWPGYLTFPTPGCWKVAGKAGKGTRLVFVLSVEPPPE